MHFNSQCSHLSQSKVKAYTNYYRDKVVIIRYPPPLDHAPDLWQYTSTYREQPYTTFSGRYIVRLGDSSPERSRVWSSFPNLNQLLEPEEVAIPTLRVSGSGSKEEEEANGILFLFAELLATYI